MNKDKPSDRPLRVLHVLPNMQCGGVGCWLMSVLRNTNRKHIEHNFLCIRHEASCYFSSEIEQFGANVFNLSCHHHNILKIQRAFQQVIERSGPYEAVHSHCGWYNGVVMKLAAKCSVPVRIAHIHGNVDRIESTRQGILRSIHIERMKRSIDRYATHGIACSEDAGKALWGVSWGKDPRWRTLFCGVDFKPFSISVDKAQVRQQLGIPRDTFVIGHVGRFSTEKNHEFMIDIMNDLVRLKSKSVLLLIGGGSLQQVIKQKVEQLGLKDQVIFAGVRSDIPRLLKGVIDCFLFPSIHEGMGLVGIEAQAAGVPCVISDHIPLATEGSLVPGLVHPISLDSSAVDWAKRIHKLQNCPPSLSPSEALKLVLQSKFNIDVSLDAMNNLYFQQPDRAAA